MSGTAVLGMVQAPEREEPGWIPLLHRIEDLALVGSLAAMVSLPLLEIVMRKMLHRGLPGSSVMTQHLTLIIGMIGGAIGAREQKLLVLSTLGNMLKGGWKAAGSIFTGAMAAVVSAILCVAGVQFVLAERPAGAVLAWGIPTWWVQTLLPLGFGAVALRLLWHAGNSWKGRAAAVGVAAVLLLLCLRPPEGMLWPAFAVLFFASLLGIPAFATLGGAALVLFWGLKQPIASIAIDHYSLVINAALPTLPLFTLAGYFLAEGGAPRRMLKVFTTLFGRLPGSSAIVTALLCAFFTSITGASGVTIIALGGLLMPILLAEKYSEKSALGLITGAGSLGLLFPPCLPLILYAIVARVPIENMFLGGILPGIVLVIATSLWGISQGPKLKESRPPFDWQEAKNALWEAKWELLLPVVAFMALFSGLATPVEAAAVTALYAFLVETFFYGDLRLGKDVPRVMTECGLLVGGILLVQGVALGLTNYLVDAEVVTRAVEWTTRTIHSPWVFLLTLDVFLLVVGCMMDIYAAIVIQTPLLAPIAQAYGLNPVHVGIVFLANLELGYLTPPVGLNLLISSFRFGKPVPQVLRAVLPMVGVLFAGILLITFIPALTTTLPRWFGH